VPREVINKASLILSTVVLAAMLFTSCEDSSEEITIGNQVWKTKNLNVDKFRNGDPIPEAKTEEEWLSAEEKGQPAWCYYDNDPANGEKYGKLYNWHAVNDPRGLAPAGYHIPSEEEWTTLTEFLGGKEMAGKKMKSTQGWFENDNATNESGFSALPTGYRSNLIDFNDINEFGYWWTRGEKIDSWGRSLSYYDGTVIKVNPFQYGGGLAVRCLKD